MNPAIVYLAQNKRPTSSDKRDRRSMLEKSLDLLFQNYNDRFQHPVIIFHEGDFSIEDQKEIVGSRREIRFSEIHFEIPAFLRAEVVPERFKGFPIGFRHMCRFYSIQIYEVLTSMGFDFYMRMDDDSFIHSKIDYDLFQFMADHHYQYGYRVDVQDMPEVTAGFGEAVRAYLKAEKIEPQFLSGFFGTSLTPVDHLRNFANSLLKQSYKVRSGNEYNLWGYYNNFHITDLSFWNREDVQSFLHYFDRIGGAYFYRWSDLPIQSVAVQVFLPKNRVHKFVDWTYEHAAANRLRLFYGGVYEGSNDRDSGVARDFRRRYGKTHCDRSY